MFTTVLNKIQDKAIRAWSATKRGTIVLPTGLGKTITALKIALRYSKEASIVAVPTEELRVQWEEEILKMKVPNLTVKCFASLYKEKQSVDLLIVDEAHLSFGPMFSNLYKVIDYKKIVLLTATVPTEDDLYKRLIDIAPVCFEVGMDYALEVGAVSPYTVYNIALPMNRSTASKYKMADSLMKQQQAALYKYMATYKEGNIFDLARKLRGTSLLGAKEANSYWYAMVLRTQTCYRSADKVRAAADIINSSPKRKWIVFSKSIAVAKSLHEYIPNSIVHHSELSKKERKERIAAYEAGVSNVLISVEAIKQGLNVKAIDSCLSLSFDSKVNSFVQTLGRAVRKVEGKKVIYINLYFKDTVEEHWIAKRTKDVDTINITIEDMKKLF